MIMGFRGFAGFNTATLGKLKNWELFFQPTFGGPQCFFLKVSFKEGSLNGTHFLGGIKQCTIHRYIYIYTVDGSEIRGSPPGMVLKLVVNNGINCQPQLVQDLFHQQYVW